MPKIPCFLRFIPLSAAGAGDMIAVRKNSAAPAAQTTPREEMICPVIPSTAPPATPPGSRHDRFGMFIHWGLYSMPARHEWIKTHERIREEKYDRYFQLL